MYSFTLVIQSRQDIVQRHVSMFSIQFKRRMRDSLEDLWTMYLESLQHGAYCLGHQLLDKYVVNYTNQSHFM